MAWNAVPEDYPRWRQPEPDGRDGDDVDEMNVEWNIDRFRKASIIERRALLLELLHGSVVELAAARSWPTDSFEQAYALVVESGVQARWRSAEKRSPDRRLKASVLGWVDESGASFKLVVDDKNGERVFESQEHSVRMAEINELKLRCHSIRWLGSSAVEISARAYRGLSDPAYGPLRIQVAESPSA
jgi:hypothetical protein